MKKKENRTRKKREESRWALPSTDSSNLVQKKLRDEAEAAVAPQEEPSLNNGHGVDRHILILCRVTSFPKLCGRPSQEGGRIILIDKDASTWLG